MESHETVRKTVSEAYAKAVTNPAPSSCCGGPMPKGVAAKVAGYHPEELATLSEEVVVNSFGCGNPLALAEVKEGDVILDLGSGAGLDLLLAAEKTGPKGRVIGVDMTDEMLEKAKQNIAAAGVANVEVRKGIIEDLPVETGSVDLVISNCVINLSPEKEKVFAEIARVLRPGGRMLVSDIVAEDLPEELKQNEALYCACIAGAISERAYLLGLKKAGLVEVDVRDRLIYDAGHLKALAASEIPGLEEALSCCGSEASTFVDHITESLVGKVYSAKFFARKPIA